MPDPVTNHPAVVVSQRAAAPGAVTSTNAVLGSSSAAASSLTPAAPATPAAIITGNSSKAQQQRLVKLYGSQMSNVKVLPYAQINWHPKLRAFAFGAWTNSGTDIYMKFVGPRIPLPRRYSEGLFYVLLQHEGRHIIQFRKTGGYPASYEQMMRFEIEAYGNSALWLAGLLVIKSARWLAREIGIKQLLSAAGVDPGIILPSTADYQIRTSTLTSQMSAATQTVSRFLAKLQQMDNQGLTGKSRETELQKFLLGNGDLPQHACIAELYGAPCPTKP
ncbi:hypothetical protein [Lysobacter sp. A378]